MRVNVQGEGHARVPKLLPDRLRGDARGRRQRRGGMALILVRNIGQSRRLVRFGIAANKNAHNPDARAAADDLAGFSGHGTPPVTERHTCGARGRAMGLGSWELLEGRLIGVQTLNGQLQVRHAPRAAFTLGW
jgi:hypothetical protein